MEIVYAHEHPKSIFLAGPSPRGDKDYNWRPEAINYLVSKKLFPGSIFVPLPRKGDWLPDYDAQADWELEYLDKALVIVFWIPRDLKSLPGFTTNVEFGLYARSGKVVLGYPEGTPKMRYLHHLAKRFDIPVRHTLKETLDKAVEFTFRT